MTLAPPRRLADDRLPVVLATGAVAGGAGLLLLGVPQVTHAHHDLRLTVVPFLLYLAMWLSMVAAMMLPTAVPLLTATRRLTAAASRAPLRGIAPVVAGYLAAWLLAGAAARTIELVVRRSMDSATGAAPTSMPGMAMSAPAHSHIPTFVGAAILALAGLHQMSPLAVRCLRACHSPGRFFARRWNPSRPYAAGMSIGWAYGRTCIGCCAGLMIALILVGMESVAWMLALGVVMAAQKNLPQGRVIAYLSGGFMLVIAAALASSAAVTPLA